MRTTAIRRLIWTLIAGTALVAAPAWGTPVNPAGGSGEMSLQEVFNSVVVGSSSSSVDVSSDQVVSDEIWHIAGSSSTSTILIEIAGFRDFNSFGIYDVADSTNRIELFAGADAAGDSVGLEIISNGAGGFGVAVDGSDLGDFAGNQFGYYLTNKPGTTFFSQAALNSDGGADHMVAYQGKGETIAPDGSGATILWGSNTYALAWEDLPDTDGDGSKPGDWDYQDFVILAQNVTPAPLPATVWLMGSALILLAGVGVGRRTTGQRKP